MRYYGPVPALGPGDWVGVELEDPVGDSDGSWAGTVYFTAQPNHAIFVGQRDVTVSVSVLSGVFGGCARSILIAKTTS